MKFNLISNIDNGYGLQRDFEILCELLEERGHEVNGIQFQTPVNVVHADVNIYLETLIDLHQYARENWYVPNPEWFDIHRDGMNLRGVTKIFCKTLHCSELFSRLPQSEYLGFTSKDLYQKDVPRDHRFLHVAGKSIVKNTEAVLNAWIKHKLPYNLTLISRRPEHHMLANQCPRVTIGQRVRDDAFAHMMNQHIFHICPSEYEGWGHCLHEALSVGSILITTNAAPMNEIGITEDRLIPVCSRSHLRMVDMCKVTADDVAAAVTKAFERNEAEIHCESDQNRSLFMIERDTFREKFASVVTAAEERMLCVS